MDAKTIENRYLGLNKSLGRMAGVWPDQDKVTKSLTRVYVFIMMTLCLITQVAKVATEYSFTTLTNQVPFIILGTGVLVKQWNYVLNESKLRYLLKGMVSDWLVERPKEERVILETYGTRAVFLSSVYRANISVCVFMFCMQPFMSPLLGIFISLNESREPEFIYPAYYFVDEEKYYYFILGHMMFTSVTIGYVFIACDVNLVCSVQHACALLAISGYRFKHAVHEESTRVRQKGYSGVDKDYTELCRSIVGHQRAIEYIENIEACHVGYFFITVGMVVVGFTVTFLKVTAMEFCAEFIAYCVFTVAQLVHILFLTSMGQLIINSNDEVFHNICEAFWYNGSVKTQSLYLLVMRKCLTPPKITGGGLIELNLDSFVQILKASVSYYTVLKSA